MSTDFRRNPFTVPLLAAVSIGIALILAGCGSDSQTTTSTPSDTTTVETTAETTVETTAPGSSEPTNPSSATSATSEPTSTSDPGPTITIYFNTGDGSDCSQVAPFPRVLAADAEPISAAIEQLMSGPTAEETASGAGSFFSPATEGTLQSVVLTDGLLLVDFRDLDSLIPNASTSCGSAALLAQLNETAFQFSDVERVRYRLAWSCDEFAGWLQRECADFTRDGQIPVSSTNERASGSGCTPVSTEGLPDGRWFGFVAASDPTELSFDLACWFVGIAAAVAAEEDGEESPPPNDFHIRNVNDWLRTLPVDPAAEVSWLPNPGDPASAEFVDYSTWRAAQPDRSYRPGIWLTVTNGLVTKIDEQYVP